MSRIEIVSNLKKVLKKVAQDVKVILYGSKVRFVLIVI